MGIWESNGHVADDVTGPWKVKFVTPICLVSRKRPEIATSWQWSTYRKWLPIIKWSRDRWRHVTMKGQGRDPDMFGAHYLGNG